MLELKLNITESNVLHSYKNNGNNKVFIYNSALLKIFEVAMRTKEKIVLRYKKSGEEIQYVICGLLF